MVRILAVALMLGAGTVLAASTPEFARQLSEMKQDLANQPTNTALLFKIADFCHDEGVKENKEAVKLAERYFRELLKIDPSNAPALALLGSTYTMKGRDAFWPGTQISLVKEGIKIMDEAAKLAPENFQVHLTRGLNNVHMPGFLKREEIARNDLAWLWEKIKAAPAAHPDAVKQEVALWYGYALKKAKKRTEARAVWEKGLTLDEKSVFAVEIRKNLEKEKQP